MVIVFVLRRLSLRARRVVGVALVVIGVAIIAVSTVVAAGLLIHGIITATLGAVLLVSGIFGRPEPRPSRPRGDGSVQAGTGGYRPVAR